MGQTLKQKEKKRMISVIVPVYKVGKYLRRCVVSIADEKA